MKYIFLEKLGWSPPQDSLKKLMEEKILPNMPFEILRVSYLDGSKVYFKNEGWVVARFSGTEPLLRIFAEMPTREDALTIIGIYEKFLNL